VCREPGISSTPPTCATVFVTKCFSVWQWVVLDTLREMHMWAKNTGLDDKAVEMGKIPEVKKFMKKVMPFVTFIKEKVISLYWTPLYHGMR